jgi:hypothetical protein
MAKGWTMKDLENGLIAMKGCMADNCSTNGFAVVSRDKPKSIIDILREAKCKGKKRGR